MAQYLLSMEQPIGPPPPPAILDGIMKNVNTLNEEMKAAGAWVFSGGLHPPSTATVLRLHGGELVTTDGPFAEAKEQIGGFWIIQAADLDAALEWARKAVRAATLPIEVRPFQDRPGS